MTAAGERSGRLSPGQSRWLILKVPPEIRRAGEVQLSVETDGRFDLRQVTDGGDPRVVGLGVRGFYLCAESDLLGRLRFMEALQADGLDELDGRPEDGSCYIPASIREAAVLTREAVIWGYRLLLGREPESEAVIEAHRQLADLPAYRRALLECAEFAQNNPTAVLPRRWVIAPVLGGRRLMWVDLGDHFVSRACLVDDYEPAETHFVKAVLRAGDVFVDVGANLGWFTLVASVAVGETGYVHAFEPRAETVVRLVDTVTLNDLDERVAAHPYGLSDGETSGVLVWASGTDNPGSAALWPGEVPANMERQAVALRPLDRLGLNRVDALKIDVEGAELRVLRGARKTLERCRPYILSELYPEMLRRVSDAPVDAYFAFLDELGYRSFIVDTERGGEEVRGFPADWHKPLVNLALVPREKPAPASLWYRAARP